MLLTSEGVQKAFGMTESAGVLVGRARVLAEHCLRYTRLAARPSWTKYPDHIVAAADSPQECEAVG